MMWLLIIAALLGRSMSLLQEKLFDSELDGCFGETLTFPRLPWSNTSVGIVIVNETNEIIILSRRPNDTRIKYEDSRFTVSADQLYLRNFSSGDVGIYIVYQISDGVIWDMKLSVTEDCVHDKHEARRRPTSNRPDQTRRIELSTPAGHIDHDLHDPDLQESTLHDAIDVEKMDTTHHNNKGYNILYVLVVAVVASVVTVGLIFFIYRVKQYVKKRKKRREDTPETVNLTCMP